MDLQGVARDAQQALDLPPDVPPQGAVVIVGHGLNLGLKGLVPALPLDMDQGGQPPVQGAVAAVPVL